MDMGVISHALCPGLKSAYHANFSAVAFVYSAIQLFFHFGTGGNACFCRSGMSNVFYYIFHRSIYVRRDVRFCKAKYPAWPLCDWVTYIFETSDSIAGHTF